MPEQDLAPASQGSRDPAFSQGSSRKSTKSSTACDVCKTRKVKCRGGPPCDYCVSHGTVCVVDQTRDGRRKIAVKRTLDDLEKDRELLIDLVATMRDGKNTYVEQLLTLIRGHASLSDIRAYIDAQVRDANIEKTPELERLQNEIQESRRNVRARDMGSIMDIQRLSDIPIFKVPAKPWTTVTDDDDLVSHLVSLWFTWSNPFENYVHRESFIKDMQAAQLDCNYCSPFLVNAILAEASALSDYIEVSASADDMASRGDKFIKEAKTLLVKIDDIANLPTIQGLAALSVVMAMVGKDRTGWMYLGLARRATEEFEKQLAQGGIRNAEDPISYALWGMFSIITTFSVSLQRYEPKDLPKYPPPKLSHGASWDTWSPYPRQAEPVPAHLSCISHGWSDLTIILGKIESDVSSVLENCHKELRTWESNLPECIKTDSASVPHVLYLHMQYHSIIMQMFGFLSFHDANSDPIKVKNIRISAAHEVLKLTNLHRKKWGIQRMSPTMIHWLSTSMFTLLDALDDDSNRKAFTELAVVTRACAHRWMLSKGILRMIQLNAAKMHTGSNLKGTVGYIM
ncbi:hypothetical protein UA08_07042 [Talaromyces atroroseus]|uniref:Zn(2)-C6 fungal-type domain-containing protein n=1 Tax=Talaromyces atroroseus TaxID=1441469 RepID=A0A225AJS1_TALAT|nr:hypothetical protein UA08_07042 [Talaromyces atroroseus]OKL57428.1 hypothetical protein UA08_07042 [Talaromyces atroroseus]